MPPHVTELAHNVDGHGASSRSRRTIDVPNPRRAPRWPCAPTPAERAPTSDGIRGTAGAYNRRLTLHVDALTSSCMGSSTLTIRIDEDLKRMIEQAAAAEDRSITDFVIRAAKLRMSSQCPRCGQVGSAGLAPAGLTPAMDQFIELVKSKPNGRIPILITTVEGGVPRAYNGCLKENEDHRGTVVLSLEDSGITLPIPRGVITGWDWDQDARHHNALVRFGGYQSGNMLVRLQQENRR